MSLVRTWTIAALTIATLVLGGCSSSAGSHTGTLAKATFCQLVPTSDVTALLGPKLGDETDAPSPLTPGLKSGSGCLLLKVPGGKTYTVARYRYRSAAIARHRYDELIEPAAGWHATPLALRRIAPREHATELLTTGDRMYSAYLLDGPDELVIIADGPPADTTFADGATIFLAGVTAAARAWLAQR